MSLWPRRTAGARARAGSARRARARQPRASRTGPRAAPRWRPAAPTRRGPRPRSAIRRTWPQSHEAYLEDLLRAHTDDQPGHDIHHRVRVTDLVAVVEGADGYGTTLHQAARLVVARRQAQSDQELHRREGLL